MIKTTKYNLFVTFNKQDCFCYRTAEYFDHNYVFSTFCQDCWISWCLCKLLFYNDTSNTAPMLQIYCSKIHKFMIQKSNEAYYLILWNYLTEANIELGLTNLFFLHFWALSKINSYM